MDITYIFSQVFVVITYALLMATYLAKSKRSIVLLCSISLVTNATAYILLGAWTGLAMCIIAMLRNLYILWDEKKHGKSQKITKKDVIFLIIVYIAIILVTIPTYNGFLSLLSVFATALYTYSIWQKSTRVYKFCGIPVGMLWLFYNGYVKSIFGVILEFVLLTTSTIGYILETKKNKRTKK
jgi:hypothetical protein